MDFLMQKEVSGLKQDIKHGEAKQAAEKSEFEKKLLGGLGDDMEDLLEHPEKSVKYVKYAEKTNKQKKKNRFKENLKKIFGFGKENQ